MTTLPPFDHGVTPRAEGTGLVFPSGDVPLSDVRKVPQWE